MDNKAIAVNGLVKMLPYSVVVLNQAASRNVREDFVFAMAKPLPDCFKDDTVSKAILLACDKLY